MQGTLEPRDAQMVAHILESFRLQLERLYWDSSTRDALEGQRLNLTAEGYKVHFWVDERGQWALAEWPGRTDSRT